MSDAVEGAASLFINTPRRLSGLSLLFRYMGIILMMALPSSSLKYDFCTEAAARPLNNARRTENSLVMMRIDASSRAARFARKEATSSPSRPVWQGHLENYEAPMRTFSPISRLAPLKLPNEVTD